MTTEVVGEISGANAMLEHLTLATFQDHVGTCFRVSHDDGHALDMELVVATQCGANVGFGAERRAPFSLELRGPRTPIFPQGNYRLEHPVVGTLSLFIVPIGPDEVGIRYQIVFN